MSKYERVVDVDSDVLCSNIIKFEQVFDESFKNKPIDILGEVISVGSKISVAEKDGSVPHKNTTLIRFSLRDLSGFIIDCVAHNELADHFNEVYWASKFWDSLNQPVIALLKSGYVTYHSDGQRMEVSADAKVSWIYFDPTCPVAEDFKSRLTLDYFDYDMDSEE